MSEHDFWRFGKTLAASSTTVFAVASNAAASTGLFSAQTWAVRLVVNPVYNSTAASAVQGGGVFYQVLDPGEVTSVTLTNGTFLPMGWVEVCKVSPGQRLSYRGAQTDASAPSLNVVEVTT